MHSNLYGYIKNLASKLMYKFLFKLNTFSYLLLQTKVSFSYHNQLVRWSIANERWNITKTWPLLSRVHMKRFAYVCKFCIHATFAYIRKSGHVYAFTHVCKICRYAKLGKFAPASDQVQISFCVYAKFSYIQPWSCEQKAKFAHVSIYLIVLNNC